MSHLILFRGKKPIHIEQREPRGGRPQDVRYDGPVKERREDPHASEELQNIPGRTTRA